MWLLTKNALLRIKKTFGRFLSLFFIVALGLGFFSGVRSTSEYMLETADKYFDEQSLFDYKVLSTYGLNEEDINSLKELDDVEKVIGSYSTDVMIGSKVYKIMALEEEVNKPYFKKGKMPQKNNECLAEYGTFDIGDVVKIESDSLNEEKYTVVGLVESPMYIGREKGISPIGNGKLSSFIYVPKENFNLEVYTEAYILNKKTKKLNSYSEEYEKINGKLGKKLNNLKPLRETIRYEEILNKMTEEISENEDKLIKEKNENSQKLNQAELNLLASEKAVKNGLYKLNQSKTELINIEKEERNKIKNGWIELNKNEQKYLAQKKYYDENKDKIKSELENGKQELEKLKNSLAALNLQIEQLKKTDPENALIPELENKYIKLNNKYNEYNKQLLAKETEYINAIPMLNKAKDDIETAKMQLNNATKKLDEELPKAKRTIETKTYELHNNLQQINQGKITLQQQRNVFNQKIKEATEEINKAKKQLNELEKPVWYLLDRTDQANYSDYKNDTLRVDNIAKVFPIFFLLVAALVCLNTMTRMVEEDRTEIGVYKALGYSNKQIIFDYVVYVTTATLVGGVIGLLVGYNVFPRVIYSIYSFTYYLPPIIINIDIVSFILILLIALILTLSVTWFSCHKVLQEEPASLLRPKAPKSGKKVFLERIPFIWRHMNFSAKVTVRNLLRYKKRILMTIIGIAGCTALTLTGFGLKDGISDIITKQFDELFKYDVIAVLSEKYNNENVNKLLKDNNIENPLLINQELYSFKTEDKKHDFFLVVPENDEKLYNYITLRDRKTKKQKKLSNDGAIITEKMSQLLNVKVGDHIKIRNSENELFIIKVSDIVENYTYHYVYMTKEYFNKVTNKELKYNMILGDINGTRIPAEKISTALLDSKEFLNVSFTKDTVDTFATMVESLNKIVFVILISSCLLALIVLYNLTNINIIERKRELATLKVLGFYDKEVSDYIYRETAILTLLGIGVGLVLGIFLHGYVMKTAEMDFIMFLKEIKPISYLYATLITLLFSIIVAIFTHFKLKKIDMIESLKSVE